MKPLLYLFTLLLFPSFPGFGQEKGMRSNSQVTMAPVEKLSLELTAGLYTEKAKVKAIFHWITDNISYKVTTRMPRGGYRSAKWKAAAEEEETVLKPLDERVAENVLEQGEAVCDGYARLFKTLCRYAGIKAEVINGYARTGSDRGGKNFRSNHSWNAVMIDSAWHLLDATWASGFVSYFGDAFIKKYDNKYFLAPPQEFINDHYPEDPAWALLPDPPVLSEFYGAPYRHTGFIHNRITSFAPAKGIIEAAPGDTLYFEVESDGWQKDLEVWDMPFTDPRLHTGPVWMNYPPKPATIKGKKAIYMYRVNTTQPQWLYVVYNGAPILQYRLQPRTGSTAAGK